MTWMMNWRTRSKLFFSFGIIFVLLAVVVYTASGVISMLQRSQEKFLEENHYIAYRLVEVRAGLNRQRAELLRIVFAKDPEERKDALSDLAQAGDKVKSALDEASERSAHDTVVSTKLTEVRSEIKALSEKRDSILALVQQGKRVAAEETALGDQNVRYEKTRVLLLNTATTIENQTREEMKASNVTVAQSRRGFFLAGIVALLLATGMALLLDRSIANPLRAISGAAETIAAGDFTVKMPPHERRDEIGVLSRTFKTMIENLRVVTQQIKEGAGVLAASSGEILAATTQVASSATETAAAVSQTTTTVEEVKQTAQLSNQKAKHVSESAKKAMEISQSGRKAVEESIDGMTQIRKQMESIGESIMKLSEQGQAIGEIIASVGDLAEQSNLLSVNAAIEAAKAGEQGKGFAVVAQEVKALAEQSKQATAQVRAILGEIQKATSTVVLSAEQGSKAVDAGMKQVTQSGESIRALAESVADAALAATQIAASSQQQFVGVDQVASAMESIKQASTQNVAGTKQVETAAQNLTRLGSNLKQLVEQFKV